MLGGIKQQLPQPQIPLFWKWPNTRKYISHKGLDLKEKKNGSEKNTKDININSQIKFQIHLEK